MTAARPAVSHATMDITNPAVAVCLITAQTVILTAREEYHRRVPVAYGLEVQNALRIRSAAVETAFRVVQISMSMEINAKTTA